MSACEKKLEGKVAIVTGAGSGIGRGIAHAFSHEGAKVMCIGRTLKTLDETAEQIAKKGGQAEVFVCDIRNRQRIRTTTQEILDSFGRIDILINNAGKNFVKPALEVTEDEWDDAIRTNLTGAFFFSQAVARPMINQGQGHIIHISSIHAFSTYPERSPYSIPKAALVAMTRAQALEWSQYGIIVNCLAPGQILTEKVQQIASQGKLDLEAIKLRTPRRMIGSVEEVAQYVVSLVADNSGLLNGQTIILDGGYLGNAYSSPNYP